MASWKLFWAEGWGSNWRDDVRPWAWVGAWLVAGATGAFLPSQTHAQPAEEIDFSTELVPLPGQPQGPEERLRYARRLWAEADRLAVSAVTDQALQNAWRQAASALKNFADEHPTHREVPVAVELAVSALDAAGDLEQASRLALRWSAELTSPEDKLNLWRLAVQTARRSQAHATVLIESLQAVSAVPARALRADEAALAWHESAERLLKRGEAQAALAAFREVLAHKPSLQVAESAAAHLLEAHKDARDWASLAAEAERLGATELASRKDAAAFRRLMDEQVAGAQMSVAKEAQARGDESAAAAAMQAAKRAGAPAVSAADLDYQSAYAAAEMGGAEGEQELERFAAKHRRDPRAAAALVTAASRADQRGDVDVAAERYHNFARQWPEHEHAPEAWRRLGELRLADNRVQEAAEAFDWAAQKAQSGQGALYARCADAFDKAGQTARALRCYERFLGSSSPEAAELTADTWVELAVRGGLLAERAGKNALARQWFASAADVATRHQIEGRWVERARQRMTSK